LILLCGGLALAVSFFFRGGFAKPAAPAIFLLLIISVGDFWGRFASLHVAMVGPRERSLWEISAHGGAPHPLLQGWNKTSVEEEGTWTPDGKHFLFSSNQNGQRNLWVLPENRGF